MSGFLEPLSVAQSEKNPNEWITQEPMNYDVGEAGSGIKITVPAGTVTDFGSVPQFLWGIISPIGRATKGYVLHDYLYKKQHLSRAMSDFILLEALEVLGLKLWHRRAVYRGVRLGGWVAWNRHKRENAKKK